MTRKNPARNTKGQAYQDIGDAERERQMIGQGGKFSNEGGNTKQIATDDPLPSDRRAGPASDEGQTGGTHAPASEDSGSAPSSSVKTGKKSNRGGDPGR